jgi:hypothetical protein
MTREQLLRIYLEDEIFIENDYLKPGEFNDFEWKDDQKIPIIDTLKILIKGAIEGEGENTTVRRANQFLDNKL